MSRIHFKLKLNSNLEKDKLLLYFLYMNFKKIPESYFITILDRLTRFEPAYIRYDRVFSDIISKFTSTKDTKHISLTDKISLAEQIIDYTFSSCDYDSYINDILIETEKKYFNFDEVSYQYLSSRLNYSKMLGFVSSEKNIPKNVQWLKKLDQTRSKNLKQIRENGSLLYPLEKIILCEGQTEYTLLESIFNLFNISFDKSGVMVLAAGGKNQVARKYYNMLDYTKIPFLILLDKDAQGISEFIKPKLRNIDRLYLIKSGEFEDLIPQKILQQTINKVHMNEYNCIYDDFNPECNMALNLSNIYKKYGFGEFKKAHFAQELKNYIENNCTKNDFLNTEIPEIINYFSLDNQMPNLK